MKITMSKDGQPRMDFKISFRLSAYQIASFLTRHLSYDIETIQDDETVLESVERRNREFAKRVRALKNREILEIVQDEIETDGIEHVGYFIGDNDLNEVCDVVELVIKKKFKGFSKILEGAA